jgi:hypothetical protein
MTTLISFLEALIVSGAIVYATYGFVLLGVYCVRWLVHSIGTHLPKHVEPQQVR